MRAQPNTPAWSEAIDRAKQLVAQHGKAATAEFLYDCCQNVPKRHFLQFVTELNVPFSSDKFKREVVKAAS